MKNISFALILFLYACAHQKIHESQKKLTLVEFPVEKYSKVVTGGFSGLAIEKINQDGSMILWTHTDRGPNAENYQDPKTGKTLRPFINPAFHPELVQFRVSKDLKKIQYLKKITLRLPNGKDISGIPNLPPQEGRTGDEYPVTISGKSLPFDLMGIDPEGICFTEKNIWMGEEYGPSLLKFDHQGKLITRYLPQGYFSEKDLNALNEKYGADSVKEILPTYLLQRKLNRGFEGIACHQKTVFVALQSPLPNEGRSIHILELDADKEQITNSYQYPMNPDMTDKIGDLYYQNQLLYLIEQNSLMGEQGVHDIYTFRPQSSEKKLVTHLGPLGFDFTDKVEGLAVTPEGTILVINDNDFGLTGKIRRGQADVDSNRISVLGIIQEKDNLGK